MTIEVYQYNKIRLPDTRVELNTESGLYVSELEIIGSEPTRESTPVESILGIISLNPISASGRSVKELVKNTIDAAGLALDATEGVSVTPDMMTSLAYAVSASIRGAIELGPQ